MAILSAGIGSLLGRIKGADPKRVPAEASGAPSQAGRIYPGISTLPDQFDHLRRLLEARMGNRGKREFVQVLRLLEVFEQGQVADAVAHAIRLGAASFDAVKQLVMCRIERRPPRLNLSAYPYLPKANVGMTRAVDCAALLEGAAA
jgi:hypothetical protein